VPDQLVRTTQYVKPGTNHGTLRSSDSESMRRSAAFAKLADHKTGKRFWVVSERV
jgi:hypothetical protein